MVIATPTNYDDTTNHFDTSAVEDVIEKVLKVSEATIVIKSTIPIGYTKEVSSRFNTNRIIFSPEFLREGKALYDNVYPKFSVDFSWAMMTVIIIRYCRKMRVLKLEMNIPKVDKSTETNISNFG